MNQTQTWSQRKRTLYVLKNVDKYRSNELYIWNPTRFRKEKFFIMGKLREDWKRDGLM